MLFNLGYQSVILLLIFVQLMLFSVLLFLKSAENKANSWLALFILLCAFYITPWMLGHAGWYAHDGYREFLFFVPFHQLFLFGPVIYLFTRRLMDPDKDMLRRDWLHFLPATLYLIYSLVVFVYDVFIVEDFYFYADGKDKDLDLWYQVLGLLSMVTYSMVCLKDYTSFKRRMYDTVSYADALIVNWLRNFLIVFITILVFRAIFTIIFPGLGDWGMKWWFYVLFGLLSSYLAIAGYTNSLKLSTFSFLRIPLDKLEIIEPEEVSTSTGNMEAALLIEKIDELFDASESYKDPELTLHELAKSLNTNTSLLSKAINSGTQMNFNDYINSFRVKAVKKALENGEQKTTTLVGIALDCGFNSKSTFIRSFKKHTGKTPSEYIKELS